MPSPARVILSADYQGVAMEFMKILAIQVDAALTGAGVKDVKKRQRAVDDFWFGLGNFLDQYWFMAEGQRLYPVLCFSKAHPQDEPAEISLPDPFAYHEYAVGIFEEIAEGPYRAIVGTVGDDRNPVELSIQAVGEAELRALKPRPVVSRHDERLLGLWLVESGEGGPKGKPARIVTAKPGDTVGFVGADLYVVREGGSDSSRELTYQERRDLVPHQLDVRIPGLARMNECIYEIDEDGNGMTMCVAVQGQPRPTDFVPSDSKIVMRYTRIDRKRAGK